MKPKGKIKKSARITPRAEVVGSASVNGVTGTIAKPLSSKGASADINVSGKNFNVGGSYNTENKGVGLRGSYTTPKGGQISASKNGDFYSGSYTSPKGVSVTASSDKSLDVNIPTRRGGGIGLMGSPSLLSARYTTPKGTTFEANKEGKKFSIGARINLNKKK